MASSTAPRWRPGSPPFPCPCRVYTLEAHREQSPNCRKQAAVTAITFHGKVNVGAIPNNTLSIDAYDTVDEDTDGLFSFSQPARLTIQWPGSYDVYAAVWWDADATGRRILDILHNGGPTILARDEPAASGWNAVNGPALSASTSWTFAAGDYVEAQLFQTSGGPLNHAPFTAFAPVLAVKWTGP